MTFILTALGFLKRAPWQLWAAIGVALLLWRVYEAGYDSAQDKCDVRMAAYVASVEAAQVKAGKAQQAVNDTAQARYQELAERSDNEHARNLEAARSDAARYIAANRLRPASDSGASSGTDSAANGDGAASDNGPGAPAIVDAIAIAESDLLICTDNTARLVAAHDWANSLDSE